MNFPDYVYKQSAQILLTTLLVIIYFVFVKIKKKKSSLDLINAFIAVYVGLTGINLFWYTISDGKLLFGNSLKDVYLPLAIGAFYLIKDSYKKLWNVKN